MNSPELRNFINGEYVAATTDSSFAVINPATEESYATSPISGAADVDAAFSAAAAAFEQWGETTPAERQLALFRIADAMEARPASRVLHSCPPKSCSRLIRFVSSLGPLEISKARRPGST
jgi:hypothetical protein